MERIYKAANVRKPDPQDSDDVGDMDWAFWALSTASIKAVVIEANQELN